MRLLLDTHIFLWYLAAASRKPTKSVLTRIEMADVVYISAASIWEAGIKIKQGRLEAILMTCMKGSFPVVLLSCR